MRKLKILIAEDDQDEIVFMKEGFEASGLFEIISISQNGEDLLNFVKSLSNESLPEVILSDLNMPRKNGYDILKELKGSPDFTHIPIIIISTSSTKANIDQCLTLGALDYLIKPETFSEYKEFATRIYNLLTVGAIYN